MLNRTFSRRLVATALLGALSVGAAAHAEQCSCPGDVNINGVVDGADLGALLSAWGSSNAAADFDGNGVVNGSDLGILLANWGSCPGIANDNCSGAQLITAGSYPFCTTFATTDGPDMPNNGSCGNFWGPIYRDVWYRYSALSSGQLTVSTCGATFDTVVAVYGSTIAGLSPCPTGGIGLATNVACNDDAPGCSLQSKVTFNVNAGSVYLIRVGGFGPGDAGSGTLNVTLTQPGESCANPRLANNVAQFQTITGNTADNPYATIPNTCFPGSTPGPCEWIKWTSSCQGVVTVSTCNPGTNFDTVVTVLRYEFDGNCWSTFVACNDDSPQAGCLLNGVNRKSWLQVQVFPSEVLYFVVSGWGNTSGAYELTIDRNCN
jgi:hypothetical protein